MRLFSKKTSCSLCGQESDGKQLLDGYVCKDCISKTGVYRVFSWKSLTVAQVRERISKNEENIRRAAIFSETQTVEKFFSLDENNKLWKVAPLIFTFDEIVDFELIQNGNSITKGGLPTAVVGGILSGGVGALVGATVGKKKATQQITEFRIKIVTRNALSPDVYINLLPAGKTKSNSIIFRNSAASAERILSWLTIITSDDKKSKASPSTLSAADEILKFKRLLDEGIITQDEFEEKKSQLLNLYREGFLPGALLTG